MDGQAGLLDVAAQLADEVQVGQFRSAILQCVAEEEMFDRTAVVLCFSSDCRRTGTSRTVRSALHRCVT